MIAVMAYVARYWRPATMQDALGLLQRPGSVVVGGGTGRNARHDGAPEEVVDLQALHLDGIDVLADARVRMGATVTLQRLADAVEVPDALRQAARRERPSTLRSQSTVGGCVARGEPDSELLATLLVHGALAQVEGPRGTEELALPVLLALLPLAPGSVLTAVTVETGGTCAAARTARTCADRPIVAAVARRAGGRRRLALTGVGPTPVLVESVDEIVPVGDFRGSAAYRKALAAVLAARAIEGVS